MYSSTQITLIVLAIPAILGIIAYGLFPRQTRNILTGIIPSWRKRFVICHLRYQGGITEVHNVVRNQTGLTKVGAYSYELSDKYISLVYKNRLHFVLDEQDIIPRHHLQQSNELILFQAAEIQTALNNSVMDYLFSKKKDMLIIGLFVIAIIAILTIIYAVFELGTMKEMIMSASIAVK